MARWLCLRTHDVPGELGTELQFPSEKGNVTASLPEPQPGIWGSEEEPETRVWP